MGKDFARYYAEHGGAAVFGQPLTGEYTSKNNDACGRSYTMQVFAHARFEVHPEAAGTPYAIQGGLLGSQVLGGWGWGPMPAQLPN